MNIKRGIDEKKFLKVLVPDRERRVNKISQVTSEAKKPGFQIAQQIVDHAIKILSLLLGYRQFYQSNLQASDQDHIWLGGYT